MPDAVSHITIHTIISIFELSKYKVLYIIISFKPYDNPWCHGFHYFHNFKYLHKPTLYCLCTIMSTLDLLFCLNNLYCY
jgi:hypothetical protein